MRERTVGFLRSNKHELVLLLAALLMRVLFIYIIHPPEKYVYSDMQGYEERAVKIAKGEQENPYDSFYPPGTHFLYAPFFMLNHPYEGVKLLNVLLGTLSCLFMCMAARRLAGRLAGVIALALTAGNYLFIDNSGYILSETPYIFFLSGTIYFLLCNIQAKQGRKKNTYAFLFGLFLCMAALVKPAILLFIPFYGVWWLLRRKRYALTGSLPFYLLGFLPLLALSSIRFYELNHKFGLVSTNGGFNFFQGRAHAEMIYLYDSAYNYSYFVGSPVAIQKKYNNNYHFYTGPYNSDFFYAYGFYLFKQDPLKALKNSMVYVTDLFVSTRIWPSSNLSPAYQRLINYANYAATILYVLPALLGFFFFYREIRDDLILLVYFAIATILLTAFVYYGDPRFRMPYDVFFILATAWLVKKIQQRF